LQIRIELNQPLRTATGVVLFGSPIGCANDDDRFRDCARESRRRVSSLNDLELFRGKSVLVQQRLGVVNLVGADASAA
jgi:hypothetical protein